eukprot:5926774-Pyramimonas_sp.AAC.1
MPLDGAHYPVIQNHPLLPCPAGGDWPRSLPPYPRQALLWLGAVHARHQHRRRDLWSVVPVLTECVAQTYRLVPSV